MRELLTDENRDYIERTREVALKSVQPIAAELDKDQTYPWEAVKALQDAGLMGIWIPEEYGGNGDGVLNLCLVVEELSRICGGVGVAYAVNALGSFPILVGGTEEQKQRWLPDVASGKRLIAFGLSEKDAGSDAGSLQTRAVREGNTYIINGEKKWTTNAVAADIYTIFCVTNPERGSRGISSIVVEKDLAGFTFNKVEDKMGIRCVTVAELHFDNCIVPADYLLGEQEGKGFAHAMMTLDRARPGVAAQALGLAQGAFDLTVDFVRKHNYMDKSLSSEQSIQFALADMATKIEAARQIVYASARALDEGHKNVGKLSAMGKVFATDTAMEVTSMAVDIFGEPGILKNYPIEKFMRDAKITQIYEGTNQIQRLVISRSILREAAAAEEN
ncbi:acyl-CoA dehydrogenase [bacterium SM23_31]|nr:MAG: acyl-CoA dehydrogenase [bacterium SM23_31]